MCGEGAGKEGALGGGPADTSLLHASVSSSINGKGVMDKIMSLLF